MLGALRGKIEQRVKRVLELREPGLATWNGSGLWNGSDAAGVIIRIGGIVGFILMRWRETYVVLCDVLYLTVYLIFFMLNK